MRSSLLRYVPVRNDVPHLLIMSNKNFIRRGMADEIIGYLKHHDELDAAELVEQYRDRHADD